MGFGLNLQGMANGYQGFKEEQRRTNADAARAVADAKAVEDAGYEAAQHSDARYDRSEAMRKIAADRKSTSDYVTTHRMPGDPDDPAPAAAPVAAPVAAPAATDAAPLASTSDARALVGATSVAAPMAPEFAGAPQARAIAAPPAAAPDAMQAAPTTAPASPIAAPPPAMGAAPAPTAPRQQGSTAWVNQMTPAEKTKFYADAKTHFGYQPSAQAPSAATPVVAPADPAAAPPPNPAVLAPAAGIPAPRPMGNVLDMFSNRIDNAARRGDSTAQEYGAAREFLAKARAEGVTQAVTAMARGDYPGAMQLYNGMGQYNGAKIIGTPTDATTMLPSNQVVPTHIVTIQNADGSRSIIDTAKDEYKLQSLAERVKQNHDAGELSVKQQQAKTMEGYRADQAENFREQRRLQELAINAKAAAGNQAPVNWTPAADAYLIDAAKGKDLDGNVTNDGAGLNFTKQVGIDYARQHGGDAMAGAGAAVAVDNQIKARVAGMIKADPKLDPIKILREARIGYLNAATRTVSVTSPGQAGQTVTNPLNSAGGDYFQGIASDQSTIIKQVAAANGIDPNDMAAALRLEGSGASAINPESGAAGPWQIMPANVKAFGGNPMDFRQGAEMAAKILKGAANKYPNDPRARLAFYNGGYAAGNAIAEGREAPSEEGRNYLTRYDQMGSGGGAAVLDAKQVPASAKQAPVDAYADEWAKDEPMPTSMLRNQPLPATEIPDPPPQQTGAGFSRYPNPAYADWAKQYQRAYEAKQKRLALEHAADKKRADAYTSSRAPYAQSKPLN